MMPGMTEDFLIQHVAARSMHVVILSSRSSSQVLGHGGR